MPDQHLREMLEKLHAELKRTGGSIDDRSREMLRAVMDDIRAILEPSADEAHPESLGQRLREAVDEFEESHPALTEAVGRVVDALAKMGI
jgi:hypothetical protein